MKERFAVDMAKRYFGNKEIVACEIGVFKGTHALEMLKHLNIRKLYLVDPYEVYAEYEADGDCPKVVKAKQQALDLLDDYKDKTVWINKFSCDAVEYIDEPLDFLYIDGNHFSPYIDNDIKLFLPLVKEGGIISGHDYMRFYGDVMRAVTKLGETLNKPVQCGLGFDWVFVK